MLLFEALTRAQFKQRPRLLIILDHLHQKLNNDWFLHLFQFFTPLQEELLEGEVAFLSVCEPLFFRELFHLGFEFVETAPCLRLLLQFITHLVVVGEGGLAATECFTVFLSFIDSFFDLIPLLNHLTHVFRCFHRFLIRELVPFFRFLFLPAVVHLFEVRIQCLNFRVEFLDQTCFLFFDLVLEGGESSVEFTPHRFDFLHSAHRYTGHLFDHLWFLFDTGEGSEYGTSFGTDLDGVVVHLLDFFDGFGVFA